MFNIYKLSTGEWVGVIELKKPCCSIIYEKYLFYIIDSIFEELDVIEEEKPKLSFYLKNEKYIWPYDKITFILPSTIPEKRIRKVSKDYHHIQSMKGFLSDIKRILNVNVYINLLRSTS
jgi:hypothetical protein